MHEKKAREKEKHLLQQEKQVYQARIRSSIRANIAASENSVGNSDQTRADYGPLTPQEHIKALADRFMKEGAEDLWNENDGPSGVKITGGPINLQKLDSERSTFPMNVIGGVGKPRNFSTCSNRAGSLMDGLKIRFLRSMSNGFDLVGNRRRDNLMGMSNLMNLNCYYSSLMHKEMNDARKGQNSETNDRLNTKEKPGSGRRAKWPRFRGGQIDSSDVDSEDEELESKGKIVRSSAALREYDVKIIKKRVPLNSLEDEIDLSQEVEAIKEEVRLRKSMQEAGREKDEEESILSTKRSVD